MRTDFRAGFVIADSRGPTDWLEGADLVDAVAEAKSLYGDRVYFSGDLSTVKREDGHIPKINPKGDPSMMPAKALKASGLGVDEERRRRIRPNEVASMDLHEAWERLVPYFRIKHKKSHGKVTEGDVVKAYETPAMMVTRFITENAKLAKGAVRGTLGRRPGYSRGPNLAPHGFALENSARHLPMRTLCVGSNPACREACLINTGNNPVADSQVSIKLARTEALILEPVAWMKMFLEAVKWHIEWCKDPPPKIRRETGADRFVPYLRPNVLSDIPWELVFPEMFSMFRGLHWYDYTKVAGRQLRSDYDLTFSFSGTNQNEVEYELRRGRRIAVVFLLPRPCKGEAKKLRCRGLPTKRQCDVVTEYTFMGQRVLDGDCHDFRPLDPPRSVIGLTYKLPSAKSSENRRKQKDLVLKKGFVLDVEDEATRKKFLIQSFLDANTGALIAPGTPVSLGAADVFEDVEATELEA